MAAASFAEFCVAWPKSAADNQTRARTGWDSLSEEERSAALECAPLYLQALRDAGRSTAPTAAVYLHSRLWRLLSREASN